MTEAVLEKDHALLSRLGQLGLLENEPPWMRELRRDALAVVREQGIPTTADESWRYTDLSPVNSINFAAAPESTRVKELNGAPQFDAGEPRLVFCNGRLDRAASWVNEIGQGVRVRTFAEVFSEDQTSLRTHFSDSSSFREEVFNALNLVFFSDGAVLEVLPGTVLEQPIQLVFLNEPGPEPVMVQPRVLILAGSNSQVRVLESHWGAGEGTYFVNSVTEICASENATVDFYKLQKEGPDSYHVGTVDASQGRSANVRTNIITLGGMLIRNNTRAKLRGEGGYAELNGLFLASGHQHVDNYTTIEHAQPHCSSRELYKGILNDKARGVFRGRIVVAEGAQKTDSKQTNNNLLLSDDALIHTKPQLEIYADDVKCTHGATIGQVDKEAMFYLRTRGIGKEAARSLLIYAFAGEVVDEVRLPSLRKRVDDFLSDYLPDGELLRK